MFKLAEKKCVCVIGAEVTQCLNWRKRSVSV